MASNRYNNAHTPLFTPKPANERSFASVKDEANYTLACAIIEQAVIDWILLDYGKFGVTRANNQYVFRADVESFFKGEWFEELLSYALPQYAPQEIREHLHIAEPERRKRRADLCSL